MQYKSDKIAGAKISALDGALNSKVFGFDSAIEDLCAEVSGLEIRGEYQEAVGLLEPYRVKIDAGKLNALPAETANLLLRIGSVSSAMGNAEQVQDSQEEARKYLTSAEELFKMLGDQEGIAQCQNKLGGSYWYNGLLEKAKSHFYVSLEMALLDESKAIAYLNIATIDSTLKQYSSALGFYQKAYQYIGRISLFTEAKIRNGTGLVYKNIGKSTRGAERVSYFDKAIIEFEGALVCYEAAGNKRSAILARNNIGFLYYSMGLPDEAIIHLLTAVTEAYQIGDKNHLSIVSDTLARTYIAKGSFNAAVSAARAAVKALESFENSNLLASSLITYGIALARAGETGKAGNVFLQSEEVANFIDDVSLAAQARLFALRELFSEYSFDKKLGVYLDAVKNLAGKEEKEIIDALREISERLLIDDYVSAIEPIAAGSKVKPSLPISVDEELQRVQRGYIEAAIERTNGNQSHAAALLGMNRQKLYSRIETNFPDLLPRLKQISKSRGAKNNSESKIQRG